MKFKKFVIKNYKAINHVEVDVSNQLIPIIGINESGKTTVLQAILAFDKTKDSSLNGVHINPRNKYLIEPQKATIEAHVSFDNIDEVDEVASLLHLKVEEDLYKLLKEKVKTPLVISRVLSENDKPYYESPELGDNQNFKTSRLIKTLVNRLPYILYFDDFNDRVPESVTFPENYKNDGLLFKGNQREWQEYIIQMFERNECEQTLQDFMSIENEDRRDDLLSDINDFVNSQIITEWKALKNKFSNLGNDAGDLELELKFDERDNKFTFKIKDKESKNKRTFNVSERSKGFQWFFNFIVKLKFNPKYKTEHENAIYLLDEPGSYLHSSAQVELLKKLNEIAESNTIVFCTHSQYLLDPNLINIGSILIADKENATISLCKYGNTKGKKTMGAYSALLDALQVKIEFNNNKFVVTEGIIDYYVLKMVVNLEDNISIVPGAGCDNLKELISILISQSDNYAIILDYDDQGIKAGKKYEKWFENLFSDHLITYDWIETGATVEDLFSENDRKRILSEAECDDIKNAIVKMYFDEKIKNTILASLDNDTMKNVEVLRNRIISKILT